MKSFKRAEKLFIEEIFYNKKKKNQRLNILSNQ